jgi:hypothetical protein
MTSSVNSIGLQELKPFFPGLCMSRLHSWQKKSFGRHSERSEETLFDQNKRLREILRAKSALRMTNIRFFPQTV